MCSFKVKKIIQAYFRKIRNPYKIYKRYSRKF
jgi:hypothetical protein